MSAPCPHPAAEPVTLLTGETVAAVCAACLARLPAEWLECQRLGGHHPVGEVTALGDHVPRWMCGRCYEIYPQLTPERTT
jgi:hypothetical protein